ncbi:Helix-turn-helix domain-containing protein [Treponema berlinense]|uniref:Helix-turn-helix domain-containing protein n=1 Tax=Treponema berlinense TaxID=225004 RepID=A0A1T4KLR7_9SPIR|nr:helix-turn-helix transcriptional regulator [Treponema berlinense]SJZ43345.1 Helix-turn-helix domain-containing protein [Treponema berlinense]
MAEERQISEYGELLKHLRINKHEMLKNMAGKLGLNSSYLSAIESGNRDIPPDLTDKICTEYGLDEGQRKELKEAELNTDRKLVQIDMKKINENRLAKEVVLNFAGKAESLTDEQLSEINAILNR